jgi:hypothetical protein
MAESAQIGRTRGVGAGSRVLLAAAVYWMSMPARVGVPNGAAPPVASAEFPRVEIVKTGSLAMVQTIDDSELQSILAAAGKPSGLIRTGGRVILAADLRPSLRRNPGRGTRSGDERLSGTGRV